jgi:vacuolar protein sorting-associated protein 35
MSRYASHHPLSRENVSLIIVQVTIKYLNGLIELIHSNLQTNQETSSLDAPKRHFQRTLDVIASREYDGIITNPT